MQEPARRQGEGAGHQDAAHIHPHHVGGVVAHSVLLGCQEGRGHAVQHQEAEQVDEAPVPPQGGADMGGHDQGDQGRQQHQPHVELAHPAVLGRAFAPCQQIATQEKGGHHGGEVEVSQLKVTHAQGR